MCQADMALESEVSESDLMHRIRVEGLADREAAFNAMVENRLVESHEPSSHGSKRSPVRTRKPR